MWPLISETYPNHIPGHPFIYLIDQNIDPFIIIIVSFDFFYTHSYSILSFDFLYPFYTNCCMVSSEIDSEGVYLVTGNLFKIHIQECQKRWAIDISHKKSRAIHILLCEKMGPFV